MAISHGNYVLSLDDDPTVAKLIESYSGLPCVHFASLESLLKDISQLDPVAAFIDIRLQPGENGLAVVPLLRQRWPFTPLIVITSEASSHFIVDALESGADDFMRKPINRVELKARLQKTLGHYGREQNNKTVRLSGVTVHLDTGRVKKKNQKGQLSPAQLRLFRELHRQQGLTCSRTLLKTTVWNEKHVSDNSLDRLVSELRKAFDALGAPLPIRSVYGKGYSLSKQTDEAKTDTTPLPKSHIPKKQTPKRLLLGTSEKNAVRVKNLLRNEPLAFECKWENTLEKILDTLSQGGVDAVVADHQIQSSTGLISCETILSSHALVPLIVLQETNSEDSVREYLQKGAQEVLRIDELTSELLARSLRNGINRKMGEVIRSDSSTPQKGLIPQVPGKKGDPSTEVLNIDVLESIESLNTVENPDFSNEVFQLFFDHTPNAIADLEKAIQSGYSEGVQSHAHRAKGMAMNVGATRLGEVFAEIEEQGRSNSPQKLDKEFNQAKEEWLRVEQALRFRLSSSKSRVRK